MFRIRMVTFDVTGTLLQFRNPVYEIYAQAGQRHGIDADPAVIKKNFREQYAKMSVAHPNFGRDTGLGWAQWWKNIVIESFKDYSRSKEDAYNISRTADFLLTYFQTPEPWTTQPGAHQLLTFLKRSYYKVGVLSNFDPRLFTILKCLDLESYFDFILTSYDCGHQKPTAAIFNEALKLGKNIDKSEALHIGNDVRKDYMAAKDAGWNGILLLPERESINQKLVNKDDVFTSLTEVKSHFQASV
ncbi:UNVERIFIED_CONTAM: hypothetical protein PYX00_001955 [Menopon gallinae]|uniref:Rhythmically expressed gene 2 protein n=1 Tax=Menopon gallinae TaxID=328185 RepID=A0AAW2IFE2_9NEOP